jgi:transcriptional regulator with XRE-family HTH domain
MNSKSSRNSYPLPLSRALRKFGADIKDARRRRRISVAVMAERASISRVTLNKIEKGDPGVSFGSYTMVLFILGLTERLSDLIELKHDEVGLELAEQDLPKRIRKAGTGAKKKKQ